MARAPDSLQPTRDRLRALHLDHEVDGAHVDAELERRRRDEARDLAGFQQLLDDEPLLASERAVVRPRELLAGELVDAKREPLGEAPVVHEDDRRAVLSDEVEDRGVDRRPDRPARALDADAHLDPVCERRDGERGRRRQLPHVLDRNDDLEIQLLADSGVDELDLAARSGDEPPDLLHRPLRRREPEALEGSVDQALESLERQRQMRAALRAGDCVHLVEDHGLDPAERLACLRGEEQEQRLGRGDEDVRRGPQHSAPLLRRRVPRAHRDRELRVEPGERASQVPLDVVVQRLERRDVEKAQAVAGRLVEAVDADQERSERLARARRCLDEHVIAARNRRPSEQLCGCRLGEGALEPGPRPRRKDVQRRHPARVPPSPYPRPVRFDVLVVGGGTAGCVLASRLSENADRRVCLLEAGPDYGPLSADGWPPEILSARTDATTHLWESGAADGRTLGGKVLGGSSSVNACMVVQGTSADYDEWGPGWSYESFRPYLERARATLRTAPANTDRPSPFHLAFVEAAQELGFPRLDDLDDLSRPVGAGSFPANVVEGVRWNAALAYLDACRSRPNLTVQPDTLVDRVVLRDGRAVGVVDDAGHVHEAAVVVLAAGAYFSPAILLRSGIGPEAELNRLAIPVASRPSGRRTAARPLRSQRGVDAVRAPCRRYGAPQPRRRALRTSRAAESREQRLPAAGVGPASRHLDRSERRAGRIRGEHHGVPHEAVVARSTRASVPRSVRATARRAWLPLGPGRPPASSSRGSTSREPSPPTEPLAELLAERATAGPSARERLRAVLDQGVLPPRRDVRAGRGRRPTDGRVLGIDALIVADASIMPTIPRANTNLTTAAIAERIAATIA